MINITIHKDKKIPLSTAWAGAKKAFHSVGHDYLICCSKMLNLPKWTEEFLASLIKEWVANIQNNNEKIFVKKIKRDILQSDSPSSLLFMMCMGPLSRKINIIYPKFDVFLAKEAYTCNNLLLIDDLKLFSEIKEIMKEMVDETEEFFSKTV